MALTRLTGSAKLAEAHMPRRLRAVLSSGCQLNPRHVPREMRDLGLGASELWRHGFLPESPFDKARSLASFGLLATGRFVPAAVHRATTGLVPRIERLLDNYAIVRVGVLVLAAVKGGAGYGTARPELNDDEWATRFADLDEIRQVSVNPGVIGVPHPRTGNLMKSAENVTRVPTGSTFAFCFATGHRMIAGTDPVAFAEQRANLIAHVHLKDVSLADIDMSRSTHLDNFDLVAAEILYKPLGHGDVGIRAILRSLTAAVYDGWCVLELERVMTKDPYTGEGPIICARASFEILRSVLDGQLIDESHS